MRALFSILILLLGYNANRNQRIEKWGKRRYDGTSKPWL